jgi:hypothetical protein
MMVLSFKLADFVLINYRSIRETWRLRNIPDHLHVAVDHSASVLIFMPHVVDARSSINQPSIQGTCTRALWQCT